MKKILLTIFIFPTLVYGGSPLLPHSNPTDEREFQNVYTTIDRSPSITSGANAPTTTPKKIGDIYIATSTSKVYIATAAVTSGSWAIVN